MAKPFKTVANSDPGDADHYGGNDIDNIATFLNAQSDFHTYSYFIYKDGANYKVKNGSTGAIDNTNSSFATVIQAIIDAIPTRDNSVFTKIKLGPGSFVINATISILDKYNVHIEGSGNGITRLDAGPTLTAFQQVWDIEGSVSGTAKNLTANTVTKAKDVTMSGADAGTFAANNYALLSSSGLWWTGAARIFDAAKGEIKQVTAVNAGTGLVTFGETLFDTYLTADTANLIKLLPARNIKFSDLTIGKSATYTDAGRWLYFKFVDDIEINNVTLEDSTGGFSSGIVLVSCINSKISDCHLLFNNTNTQNDQYGISINNCCQNIVVSNCTATGPWRHPFEGSSTFVSGTNMQGITRAITFENCTSRDAVQYAFDNHHGGEGITFSNCSVLGKRSEGGFNARARRTKILDCYVEVGQDSPAIKIDEDGHEGQVVNCHVHKSTHEGIHLGAGLCRVTGNMVYNSTLNGIQLDAGSDNTIISNNIVRSCDGDALEITDSDKCIIMGNIFRDNAGWGIQFSEGNCSDNIITGNNLQNNTSGAISFGNQSGNMESNNMGVSPAITDNPYAGNPSSPMIKTTGNWFAQSTTHSIGVLGSTTATGATNSQYSDTTNGRGWSFTTGAVANNNAGLTWAALLFRREWGNYLATRIMVSSTSDVRVFVGWMSTATALSGEDPLNALSGVGVGKRASDTNWQVVKNDGSGATTFSNLSALPFTTSAFTIYLELDSTNFKGRINGLAAGSTASDIPAATTMLTPHVEIETGSGAADKTITIFPIWARIGS